VASEDTAEARKPAWCHLLSSGWRWGFPLGGDLGVMGFGELFPQVQFLKKSAIAFGFGAMEVIEETATPADHREEATPRGEVFD
jgi:hypothetical protein